MPSSAHPQGVFVYGIQMGDGKLVLALSLRGVSRSRERSVAGGDEAIPLKG
jgi:hypothetical protein